MRGGRRGRGVKQVNERREGERRKKNEGGRGRVRVKEGGRGRERSKEGGR